MVWIRVDASADGRLVVEFPDLSRDATLPKEVLVKDGTTGATTGRLEMKVAEDELNGQLTGAFCGTTGRFIVVVRHSVAAYQLGTGRQIVEFPEMTWRGTGGGDEAGASVACSGDGEAGGDLVRRPADGAGFAVVCVPFAQWALGRADRSLMCNICVPRATDRGKCVK